MRLQLSTLFFLLVFCFGKTFSQHELPPPMQFGTVLPAELAMTTYEKDTSVAAVVLCDYGKSWVELFTDGAKLRFQRHRRIKILNRSGFAYGDVSIPYYSYKNQEQFYFGEGMVHLPNGEKTALDKKDVFIEAVSQFTSRAKFTFPQLQEGCIIEYTYFINSESIYELTDWFFQEEIPVRRSELRVDFPNRFAYSYLFQGNEGMRKEPDDGSGQATYSGRNGTIVLADRRFVMHDAPAMRPEAFITTMDDYRARIRFQLAEVHYSDGRKEKVMDTWENMRKDLEHHPYFGEQYLRKGNYKKMVQEVLPMANDAGTPEEKARFFYDYLLKNVAWNGHYSLATRPEKLDDIFATRRASSGELNLMLLVLLREAGVEAFPLITSTRSNGKMYEEYPLIDQFNHTLLCTELDGQRTLLDATDPLRPMGHPSLEALNGRGVLIADSGTPKWIDINPPKTGADVFFFDLSMDDDGSMDGVFKGAYKGYSAIPERRHYFNDASGKHWQKRLTGRLPDVNLREARTGNLDNFEESFYDTLDLHISGAAQLAGDFIYLPPVLYSQFLKNPFKQPERLYPVNFPYPFTEQYFLTLKLPAGYAVEELPTGAHFSLPDKGGTFYFSVEEKSPGELSVSARLFITKLTFTPDEYPSVKELFDLVAAKCREHVVLRKL